MRDGDNLRRAGFGSAVPSFSVQEGKRALPVCFGHTRASLQAHSVPVSREEVEQRKGGVVRILGECVSGGGAGVLDGFFDESSSREFGQRSQATRVKDPCGDFRGWTKQAADLSRLVQDGTVRKRVIGLFQVAAAVHEEANIILKRRLSLLEDLVG